MNHSPVYPTQQQRDNLATLASYLEGELEKGFDMEAYLDDFGDEPATTCGTVACAAGHGPDAGIKPLQGEEWSDYTLRNFGARAKIIDSSERRVFAWCFAGEWESTDNTPKGAAKRIKYMLENGVPENYGEQLLGQEPYIFEEEK